jgi:hypothetical protein
MRSCLLIGYLSSVFASSVAAAAPVLLALRPVAHYDWGRQRADGHIPRDMAGDVHSAFKSREELLEESFEENIREWSKQSKEVFTHFRKAK